MIATPITICLLIIAIVILIVQFIKGRQFYQRLSSIPEFLPYNVPLFNAMWFILRIKDKIGIEVLKTGMKLVLADPFDKTGLCVVYIGNYLIPFGLLLTSRTEILRAILNNKQTIHKPWIYKIAEDFLGKGLITAPADVWTKHRKILNPTFHQSMLKNFAPIMSKHGHIMIDRLKEILSKNNNNMTNQFTPILSDTVMGILQETLLGTSNGNNFREYRDKIQYIDYMNFNRMQNIFKLSPWTYMLSSEGRYYYKQCQYVKKVSKALLEERIVEVQQDIKNCAMTDLDKKLTIIDSLILEHLKDKKSMTHDMIIDEIMTFLFAGWDTTTWAITFTLQMIASHSHVQDKLLDEINHHMADFDLDNTILTMEDVSKLKYLDCVLNETLRLFPPINIHSRQLKHDLHVDIDGQTRIFPAGLVVTIDSDIIHQNPKYWPEPQKFNPDRFLSENSKNRDPLSFLPFSYGPRNCIGKTFAMVEEKIIIAQLLKHFKIIAVTPIDKMNITQTGIVRKTRKPLEFIFQKRDN